MKKPVWILCIFIFCLQLFAQNRTVHLFVDYKKVSFAGKTKNALAINNTIPAPTLHFKENDKVTIYVHNLLKEDTSIHWHGLLVPWQMDGVLGISQQGIPPGKTFKYQFILKQSGTYWYHAHARLQEQQGLYGALIIDPSKKPKYHYSKDYVVVLSDWTNANPKQVMSNLKKDGDYYGPRFPLQPSLTKFINDYRKGSKDERHKLLDDYKMMQQMRMSIYDLNDVAYDAFLLNGYPSWNPWTAPVKLGDVVRLRFIGAAGNTIYRVKIPESTLQMVHVQGNDVSPYTVNNFSIAPGETYDVLIKIQKNKPYIIYAESRDTVGAAYGALIIQPSQMINYKKIKPFPEPQPVTREMMKFMMDRKNEDTLPRQDTKINMNMTMQPTNHQDMSMHPMKAMTFDESMGNMMPTESLHIGDSIKPPNAKYYTSIGTKYQKIVSAVPTNNANKPIAGVINMELFGYMDQFIWFINGVPEYKAKPILLEPGKRYRIVFTNTSMMYHPMHIHGHWFILRKGNDAYDPLLHTINVPAGATITADIDTDASGQWFFHCHLLYHMMAGMARTFQYTTLIEITKGKAKPQNIIKQTNIYNRPIVRVDEVRPIDTTLVKHPMGHHAGFWLATFLDVGADPFNNAQRLNYKGLYGPDYNKLELFVNDAELYKGTLENADIDIFYWHLIRQFWAVKGGVNYFNKPSLTPYWQFGLGVEGIMPWYINTDIRTYYYKNSLKLDAELTRDTQITNNFFIKVGVRSILASKNILQPQLGSGLNQMRYILRPYYRIMPGINAFIEYENEQYYGAFKKMQKALGEQTRQNTVTLGLTTIF